MAHHAGPWTDDAFHELRRLDRIIARLLRVIAEKAPRPYELIVLSDHGQSFGFTFKQRYGVRLQEFIQQQIPQGKQVTASMGSDDGSTGVISLMNELDNIQQQGVSGTTGRAMLQQANKLLQKGIDQRQGAISDEQAEVKVAFSGNLANVYFTDFDHRVRVSELNSTYPGLVDALVQHEGVGFVVGYDDEGAPICFGKKGARNLNTGLVAGEDPLIAYADNKIASVELRAEQVRRVFDFPHAGDLMLNSPVYPDGTVAAYEELIGNHGGVGGEQTDAFILGPVDMKVPETRNSTDVYAILNARRGLAPQPITQVSVQAINPWAVSTLIHGLSRVGEWLNRVARMLVFDKEAYLEVAADAYMTGPAILIAIMAVLLPSLVMKAAWYEPIVRLGFWLLNVSILWLAGRRMGSKEDFTPLFRTFGFALVGHAWLLLRLIPQVAPLALMISLLVWLLTIWMSANAALKLKGWRTLVLPVIVIFLYVIGVWAFDILLAGAEFTIQSLLSSFGIR